MYVEENTFYFTGSFLLNSLKRPPTNSSLSGVLPVRRRVLRVLRESSVRFRDVSSGSASASPGSSSETVAMVTLWQLPVRLLLAFFFALALFALCSAGKKHITSFNSDQSSACNLIPSGVRKCFSFSCCSYQMSEFDTQTWRMQTHTHIFNITSAGPVGSMYFSHVRVA